MDDVTDVLYHRSGLLGMSGIGNDMRALLASPAPEAAAAVTQMNLAVLSGPLAGSMTAGPALSLATDLAGSDAPTIAYATVYPLTTLLRILTAQVLALILIR